MNNNLFMVAVFWGVWIIIPIVFDGVLTLIYMITILIKDPHRYRHNLDFQKLPKVSIIIPTYNEEENIDQCLNFLKIQNYPHDKIQIIVVDNGSTDQTSQIVKEHIEEINVSQNAKKGIFEETVSLKNNQNPNGSSFRNINGKVKMNGYSYQTNGFGGVMDLVVHYEKGKAKALNSGIKKATGEIIFNIDCRSFLAPDAIYNMVAKFVEHPEYGAAMGTVEIDWNLIYERDAQNNFVLDQSGHYKVKELTRKEEFLVKCQFLEYLVAFRVGRHFMDLTNSIYTLSGAFSAFRRDVLLKSTLYRARTVTEDTDLTLDLQEQDVRIGFAADAKAYLKPVLSFEKFYAQRIRWHRGQIEVVGLHERTYGDMLRKFQQGFWHNLILMIDHTFSFPRNIWVFLLPLFFLFGYSMTLIVEAIFLMYAFYVFMDFLNAFFCYRVVDDETRGKIKDSLEYCLVIPIYRLLAFLFRFSGYLEVLKEPQAWSTPINPVRSVKKYRESLRQGYNKTFGRKEPAQAQVEESIPTYGPEAEIEATKAREATASQISPEPAKKPMDGVGKSYDYKER